MSWHGESSDDAGETWPADSFHGARPIRRVSSPTAPRAWRCNASKADRSGQFYQPRVDHSFYKPGPGSRRYLRVNPSSVGRRDHFQRRFHHVAQRERDTDGQRQREHADGGSPPPKSSTARPVLRRSTSSRDKDIQHTVSPNGRSQSGERNHRGTGSKGRKRSRETGVPSTASQAAARDRAIQLKRKEIDKVYHQECEKFVLVVKMLIAKDPSLERPIQPALQENLRDIGTRCVEAMQRFIEDYDSMEPPH